MLIADILFAVYTSAYNAQEWFIKSLLDSLWMSSYLLFGYALFEFSFSLQDAYKNIVTKMQDRKILQEEINQKISSESKK